MDPQDLALISERQLDLCVLRPTRTRLAAALSCVYMLDEETANSAASANDLRFSKSEDEMLWTEDGTVKTARTTSGHFDAAAAWEALASQELIPIEWLESDERLFITLPLHRALIDKSMDPRLTPHPHTVKGCVCVAASVASMINAEALLRATNEALQDWGGLSLFPKIIWQVDDRDTLAKRYYPTPSFGSAAWGTAGAKLPLRESPEDKERTFDAPIWRAQYVKEAIRSLRLARIFVEDASRKSYEQSKKELAATPVVEKRNPFEPMLRLWLTGMLPIRVENQGILALLEL